MLELERGLSVEGEILRMDMRALIRLRRHGCVPPHRAGAAFPKGAWPAKKGCPLQDLGAFPRLILSLPVVGNRGRGINTSTGRDKTRSIQQKLAKAPRPGGRIVERIAVEPQNCAEY